MYKASYAYLPHFAEGKDIEKDIRVQQVLKIKGLPTGKCIHGAQYLVSCMCQTGEPSPELVCHQALCLSDCIFFGGKLQQGGGRRALEYHFNSQKAY